MQARMCRARFTPTMPRTAGARPRAWRPDCCPSAAILPTLFGGLRADAVASRDHRLGGHVGRRLQRRGARLLDPEGRRPRRGVDPRWRHGGLAEAGLPSRADAMRRDAGVGLSGGVCATICVRSRGRRARGQCSGKAVLLDSRSDSYFVGREKSPQAKRAGRLPDAVHLDHTRVFDPATKRLKPLRRARATVWRLPDQPGRELLQHRPSGRDQLVRAVGSAAAARRTLYDGSMSEWTEDDGGRSRWVGELVMAGLARPSRHSWRASCRKAGCRHSRP